MFESYKKLIFTGVNYFEAPQGPTTESETIEDTNNNGTEYDEAFEKFKADGNIDNTEFDELESIYREDVQKVLLSTASEMAEIRTEVLEMREKQQDLAQEVALEQAALEQEAAQAQAEQEAAAAEMQLDDRGSEIVANISNSELIYNAENNVFSYQGEELPNTPSITINEVQNFITDTDAVIAQAQAEQEAAAAEESLDGVAETIVANIGNSELTYDSANNVFTYKGEELGHTSSTNMNTVRNFVDTIDDAEAQERLEDVALGILTNISNPELTYNPENNTFIYQGAELTHTSSTNINGVKKFIEDSQKSSEYTIRKGDKLSVEVNKLRNEINTPDNKVIKDLNDLPVYGIDGSTGLTVRQVNRIDPGDIIQIKKTDGVWGVHFTQKNVAQVDLPKNPEPPKKQETNTSKTNTDTVATNSEKTEDSQASETKTEDKKTEVVASEESKETLSTLSKQEIIAILNKASFAPQIKSVNENFKDMKDVDFELKENEDGTYDIVVDTPYGDGYDDLWKGMIKQENIDISALTESGLKEITDALQDKYETNKTVVKFREKAVADKTLKPASRVGGFKPERAEKNIKNAFNTVKDSVVQTKTDQGNESSKVASTEKTEQKLAPVEERIITAEPRKPEERKGTVVGNLLNRIFEKKS